MRVFEVVLIVANLAALLVGYRKQTKRVWSGVAAANVIVLLIHGVVEGFRYQLAFSYAFVVLLAVYGLLLWNAWFAGAPVPRAARIVAVSVAVIAIGVSAFLAYALPVFSLPQLT